MASVTLNLEIPDNAVPLLRRTLGTIHGSDPPTTAAQVKSMLEAHITQDLQSRMRQQRQAEKIQEALADEEQGWAV